MGSHEISVFYILIRTLYTALKFNLRLHHQMNRNHPSFIKAQTRTTTHWSAIFSLFMGVTSLISAEFIPISLLTSIAKDLTITEGQAGQSVTMVGIFAVISSLLLAPLTKYIDRKKILLSFSLLLIIANILVATAANYWVMLIGRALLGICVGGFWSMTSAVVLQLAMTKDIPRALSIVYAGVSIATIISLPLASFLGEIVGWRTVFFMAALIGVVSLIWQSMSLPQLPAPTYDHAIKSFDLLKQNWVLLGIIATVLSYAGYHLFFTYLKPFLQYDLHLKNTSIASLLLIFGIANCAGTIIAGLILGRYFRSVMISIHVLLAVVAFLLLMVNSQQMITIMLIIIWGFIFGFIPVGWSTWITRTLSKQAELVGGLSVAAIQFSIGIAAGLGGLTFDHFGITGIFICAMVVCLAGAVVIRFCFTRYQSATGRRA